MGIDCGMRKNNRLLPVFGFGTGWFGHGIDTPLITPRPIAFVQSSDRKRVFNDNHDNGHDTQGAFVLSVLIICLPPLRNGMFKKGNAALF
jgi:hypothetical protein